MTTIITRTLFAFNHSKVLTPLYSLTLFRSQTTQRNFSNNRDHLESFIRSRCKSGNLGVDEALDLFIRLVKFRPLPSIYPFNQLLGFFVKMKEYSTVLEISKSMNVDGVDPDIVTFNTLINCCCSLSRTDLAFSVFSSILKLGFKPDEITFTTLLRGLVKEGKVEQHVDLYLKLMRMMEEGGKFDVQLYNMIIHSLCEANLIDEAENLFQDMVDRGVKPDVYTYSVLVDARCKEGLITKAEDLIEKMREKGVEPNTVIYNNLMKGYCLQERIREAERVFTTMISRGHEPSVISYGILIDGYCKSRRMTKVIQLYTNMICKGLTPTIVIYTDLIKGLFHIRRVSAAKMVLRDMLVYGENHDLYSFSTLIDGLFNNKCYTEAMELFYGDAIEIYGLEANIVIYTNFIQGMCKFGKKNEAIKFFYSLTDKGLQPDIKLYHIMIDVFFKEGMPKEAEDLFLEIERNCLAPNDITFSRMVRGFLRQNSDSCDTKASQYHNIMKDKGFQLDAKTESMLQKLESQRWIQIEKSTKMLNPCT